MKPPFAMSLAACAGMVCWVLAVVLIRPDATSESTPSVMPQPDEVARDARSGLPRRTGRPTIQGNLPTGTAIVDRRESGGLWTATMPDGLRIEGSRVVATVSGVRVSGPGALVSSDGVRTVVLKDRSSFAMISKDGWIRHLVDGGVASIDDTVPILDFDELGF